MSDWLRTAGLPDDLATALEALLLRSPHDPPLLEDVWALMDSVWFDLGCDNRQVDWQRIDAFYRHPIWVLNGLFIEQDPLSQQHRHGMAEWIVAHRQRYAIRSVLDYGGGFGTLARILADRDASLEVLIYEAHPAEFAVRRAAAFPNIRWLAEPDDLTVDCLVCTDVLEHVPDPLALLERFSNIVRPGGVLLIANCFFPVIQCHLPSTFHLRYSFAALAATRGLRRLEPCPGGHGAIFVNCPERAWPMAASRLAERVSRGVFPMLSLVRAAARKLLDRLRATVTR